MPDHPDDLETWLNARVQPLPPPPGSFERIQVRARRRRVRRAVFTAAGGVALVIVGAGIVPQVVIPTLESGPANVATGRSQRPAASASPATSGQPPGSTMTSGPPAGPVAPPALSVTFVGANTGWVMGQAVPPGQCDLATAPCIRLARTDTAGAAWAPVNPPPTHGPAGPTGVSQVRFLDTRNGWAFGPQLWATHNGGQTWTRIGTRGRRVTALETRGNRVFAVWARCTGSGADFAAHCSRFTLYSAAASGGTWVPVPGASWAAAPGGAGSTSPASASDSVALVLTGTTAYLLSPDGVLFTGPLTGSAMQSAISTLLPPTPPPGSSTPATPPASAPCQPGPAQPGGQPAGALLATNGAGLALVCPGGSSGGRQPKAAYASADGGRTWQKAGTAPDGGTAICLSGSPGGTLLLATSLGIDVSTSGGRSWAAAKVAAPPAGGFAYLGMTNNAQGVAVPADPGQHAIWFTYDGGLSWAPFPVGV